MRGTGEIIRESELLTAAINEVEAALRASGPTGALNDNRANEARTFKLDMLRTYAALIHARGSERQCQLLVGIYKLLEGRPGGRL